MTADPAVGGAGQVRSSVPSILAVVLGIAIVGGGILLSRQDRLTILVVSMDTTRLDRLTPYGSPRATSPTLDRLAREGVRFTQARSTSSWTLPAHMSLFTGLPPTVHGVTIDFQTLPADRPTLGRVFKDAGFHTVGLYTAPYVHPRFGFGGGMDFYEGLTQNPMAYDLPPEQVSRQMGLREAFSHQEITSPLVADRARWFLSSADNPRTLLFLHLFDPHYDYRAPAKFVAAFADPAYAGPVIGDGIMAQAARFVPGMPDADLSHLRDLYDAEIAFTDKHLGDVIAALEKRGLDGRTLVAVVSDHGEEFLDAGRFGHRMTLRDEVLRVPMVFWGPGLIPAGLTVDDAVSLCDVLPTLMDYADIDADPRLWGRSLRPLIEGRADAARPQVASLTYLHREGPEYYTQHDALVYDGLKAVRSVRVPWSPTDDKNIFNPPDLATAVWSIYDLRADPGETDDLQITAPDDPRVTRIRRAFEEQQQSLVGALDGFSPVGRTRAADAFAELPLLDQIKAVGYLDAR